MIDGELIVAVGGSDSVAGIISGAHADIMIPLIKSAGWGIAVSCKILLIVIGCTTGCLIINDQLIGGGPRSCAPADGGSRVIGFCRGLLNAKGSGCSGIQGKAVVIISGGCFIAGSINCGDAGKIAALRGEAEQFILAADIGV